MRFFRRHRPEPAAQPGTPTAAWPPQPAPPARAVQVVTGPPPLRTPEPASATPPPDAPSATTPAPEAEPQAAAAAEPMAEPAAPAPEVRAPEWRVPTGNWHLAAAETRVSVASMTHRRATPREHQRSRWHQV